VPLYTRDILRGEIDDLLLCKLSRFLGYPQINRNMAYRVISSIQSAMADFIRRKVKKHIELHYTRGEVPLVVAGSGKHLLYEILDHKCKYVLPFDNTHTCVGLAHVFLKKECGRMLRWKEGTGQGK
jgi:succinylglutamate desuccinylase